MPLPGFDRAAVAAALAQVADRPEDRAEAFLEASERLVWAPGEEPAPRLLREWGLAVRLRRGGRTWLASEDGLDDAALGEALRRVSRAGPPLGAPRLGLEPAPEEESSSFDELAAFPARLERRVRDHHVAFPMWVRLERHRRWLQVVAPRLHPEPESEALYSLAVELPFGRYGGLFPTLGDVEAEAVALSLVRLFRSRDRPPPAPGRAAVVLGPGAAAVLLHEAVAHALEADTLAMTGNPERAVGLQLGGEGLSVLDDPAGAPPGVRRRSDDEGMPVVRRWLLRDGRVEQPLADDRAADRWEGLLPGAARRSSRHEPPAPRSTHLELLPGEASLDDLLGEAEGGLFVPEAERGALEPVSGRFRLTFGAARRIRSAAAGEPVGAGSLSGSVVELLGGVRGIGAEAVTGGAGWCAKGGQRLPVWACAPSLLLAEVEVA